MLYRVAAQLVTTRSQGRFKEKAKTSRTVGSSSNGEESGFLYIMLLQHKIH